MKYALVAVLISSFLASAQTAGTNATTKATDDGNTERDFLEESAYNSLVPSDLHYINAQDGSITEDNFPKLIENLFTHSNDAKEYASANFSGLFNNKGNIDHSLLKKASFIVNIILWSADTSNGTASPDERWYVYRNGHLSSQKRLFGVHRFWFLYVHLRRGSAKYTTRYDFTSTQATPVPLQHLYSLASILVSESQTKAAGQENIWGGKQLDFTYKTSDIAITSKVTRENATAAAAPAAPASAPASASAPAPAVPGPAAPAPDAPASAAPASAPAPAGGAASTTAGTTAVQAHDGVLDAPVSFHNEAPYWWDVSLGFPVTNVNDLSFDSTANGLTPRNTDKRRLFGLLNFFPFAFQRRQVSTSNFSWIPSLIAGLPLASQPLHRPLLAAGWGPPLLQFYAGAIVAKQMAAPAGSTLTKSVCTGWCPQFSFGINFGIKSIADKLTKK